MSEPEQDVTLLDELLSGLPDATLIVDADARILAANTAALAQFGSHLVGNSLFGVMRQPDVFTCIERARATGEITEVSVQVADASLDSSMRVTTRFIPRMAKALGLTNAMVVTITDISGTEMAEQARRDFVANVSHELRSPLTSLMGLVETLARSEIDAAARSRFTRLMFQEGRRMTKLVDDLLSLSRVEAMERLPPTEAVSLLEVLESVLNALRPQAKTSGLSIDFEPASFARMRVAGDGDQLVQVFRNLVHNGVKYGAAGGVLTIRGGLEEQPGQTMLRIDVVDRGEGIDERHLHRLTERFYRVDSHRSREVGGTGLGLAIVKHILNRHRGRLTIDSRLGAGSCFSVLLPPMTDDTKSS